MRQWKRRQVYNLLRDIRNNLQLCGVTCLKLTSNSSSEDGPVGLSSWESHFSFLFSDNPPPLDTTCQFILFGHFAELDHAKTYITITIASIQPHIRRLKPGKALDSDGLPPKNVIYRTVELFLTSRYLFQACISCISLQHISDPLCDGLVTGILRKDPKSYEAYITNYCIFDDWLAS